MLPESGLSPSNLGPLVALAVDGVSSAGTWYPETSCPFTVCVGLTGVLNSCWKHSGIEEWQAPPDFRGTRRGTKSGQGKLSEASTVAMVTGVPGWGSASPRILTVSEGGSGLTVGILGLEPEPCDSHVEDRHTSLPETAPGD